VKIDLSEVRRLASNGDDLSNYIQGFFNQCSPDDPPFLSDLILGQKHGSLPVMEALGERYQQDRDMRSESEWFRWKIHCFKDEWGNVPQPGDIVKRRIQLPLQHKPGKPVTSGQLSMDKADGTYEEKWIRWKNYKVDKKGCISCEFQDAVWFLICWGIHPDSKAIISMHKREHSGDPQIAPNEQKIHAWYWRCKEAHKDYYDKLPIIEPSKEKKRGVKE
jgi:hypothetical protein